MHNFYQASTKRHNYVKRPNFWIIEMKMQAHFFSASLRIPKIAALGDSRQTNADKYMQSSLDEFVTELQISINENPAGFISFNL